MPSYEQLGLFYLGRRLDASTGARLPDTFLYESRDLLTHAVCVGMTGSGKTGLGIGLIEEAAIDGIPVLAIDPKGDLSNLLLTFPDLAAADLAPWMAPNPSAPAASLEDLAAREVGRWRSGLEEWHQSPERIRRLREAADVRVYTPGSRAGIPLALLDSLGAAAAAREEDAAAAIATRVSSLLTLAGLPDAAPHAREHALLATILASAPAGRADISWLVQQIQRPSFDRVGVIDLETFYPARDRQDLALRFNSVLASPGFDVWLHGEPLDIGRMLYDPAGRPRLSIVSIAHLGDAERMLVVSMLLEAVLEWTRRQSGTSTLRALVYMDEVFGYLPPVASPPSKRPLLTLLKQARAFGVGIVLATQNPVDLDYKALSNAGTWFLGRLQTERDKARVLDGIESIASSVDRATLDRLLSALRPRVFLMHNVHEPEPVLFETRWTLCYLRGPMTRDEIERAVALRPPAAAARDEPPHDASGSPRHAAVGGRQRPAPTTSSRPVIPAGVQEAFVPPRSGRGTVTAYTPALYASAHVRYRDARRGLDHSEPLHLLVPFADGAAPLDWDRATPVDVVPEDLGIQPDDDPQRPVAYEPVPGSALQPKSYTAWSRAFAQWVRRTQRLQLWRAPALSLTSQPGESERDFRIRVQLAAHEARDAKVDALRATYAPKLQRLAARIHSAEDARQREAQQAQQQQMQSVVSIGATMLGALFGRKAVSMSTLGRATTAARGVSRSMKETQDVARAAERIETAQAELEKMEAALEDEIAAMPPADATAIEPFEIAPAAGGVEVRLVTLAWVGGND
jgi:hypothetical protein